MSGSGAGQSIVNGAKGVAVGLTAFGLSAMPGAPAALANSRLDTVDNAAQTAVVENLTENVQKAEDAARDLEKADTIEREIEGLPEETSAEYRDAEPEPGPEFWSNAESLAERGVDGAAPDVAPEAGADAGPDGGIW